MPDSKKLSVYDETDKDILKDADSYVSEFSVTKDFAHKKGYGGGGGSPVKFKKREGGMGDCY